MGDSDSDNRKAAASAISTRVSRADWRVFVRDIYALLFDLFGDWTYLYALYHRDYDGDGDADDHSHFHVDYTLIVNAMFVTCVFSTVFSVWTLVTMTGRSCGKSSVCCKCTIPKLALATVLLEDVPQLLLTAYIDYGFSGELSPAGMLNITSSLNALVNRATSRYDEIVQEGKNDSDDASKLASVYEAMP